MFGLGIGELFICIIALIIMVKPQDYPQLIRKIAKGYHELLDFKNTVIREMNMLDIDTDKNRVKDEKMLYYKPNKTDLNQENKDDENIKSNSK